MGGEAGWITAGGCAGYDCGMGLVVDDDMLRLAGLSEADALVEFACRLYQADRISLPLGARLARLSRPAFEGELRRRGIAVYVVTRDDFEHDLRTLGMPEPRA